MKLPKYHETFIPILDTVSHQGIIHSRELAAIVRQKYYSDLPQSLLSQKTNSGVSTLEDRILWGKSYLKMGKLLSYPKRGFVQITKKGETILSSGSFTIKDLLNDEDYIKHRATVDASKEKQVVNKTNIDESPQDLIDSGFSIINEEVKTELLVKLKTVDPYFFEKVILILLKKMGYGDFIETSKSVDGGIDGIINEDKLGLEKIYTQAKRYDENKVREKDIRNFIGAMSGDTNKGVFITTSTFDEQAIRKAQDAHHSIILIDGVKLVNLMHQYNVGIQIQNVYEVKEIDNDFFEQD